ncbi:uncharacterized protein AKAW2_11372S [Neofusicoccum parvum]|uniref:Uncharacterized protein AKAW2_11372S n=1 Tax=Neofusicoccum parvum TaxID=310453 RepID=A0ACB5RXE9_9PEZI|nr:uncharacterized protein AKAW2_11372S [Neofusicoccum parvum]
MSLEKPCHCIVAILPGKCHCSVVLRSPKFGASYICSRVKKELDRVNPSVLSSTFKSCPPLFFRSRSIDVCLKINQPGGDPKISFDGRCLECGDASIFSRIGVDVSSGLKEFFNDVNIT